MLPLKTPLPAQLRQWLSVLHAAWLGARARAPLRPVLRALTLWRDADGLRMSAAMSFYGILSLAPLLVLLVLVLGQWLDTTALQHNLLGRVHAGMGAQAAEVVQQALAHAFTPVDGGGTSLLAFAVFASGAVGVFAELLSAFERLWRQDRLGMPSLPWWNSVLLHLRGLLYIVVVGFLLLGSLLLSIAMGWILPWLEASTRFGAVLPWVNELAAFVFCAALFIGLMRLSSGPKPALRYLAWGAVVGAVLFSLVRHALARYLSGAPIVSAYGAAGSLVAVLMWFYVSSAILLFAAAWARALADAGWAAE